MKNILLILVLFYTVNIFGQPKSSYRLLTGAIDKYPVTMHLHQYNHIYLGYYYYNSREQPIYFNGEDASMHNKITLSTLTTNPAESFVLSLNNKTASGTWKQDGNDK